MTRLRRADAETEPATQQDASAVLLPCLSAICHLTTWRGRYVSAVIDFELKFDRYRFVVAVTPTEHRPVTSSFVFETLLCCRSASVPVIAIPQNTLYSISVVLMLARPCKTLIYRTANGVFSQIRRSTSERDILKPTMSNRVSMLCGCQVCAVN